MVKFSVRGDDVEQDDTPVEVEFSIEEDEGEISVYAVSPQVSDGFQYHVLSFNPVQGTLYCVPGLVTELGLKLDLDGRMLVHNNSMDE